MQLQSNAIIFIFPEEVHSGIPGDSSLRHPYKPGGTLDGKVSGDPVPYMYNIWPKRRRWKHLMTLVRQQTYFHSLIHFQTTALPAYPLSIFHQLSVKRKGIKFSPRISFGCQAAPSPNPLHTFISLADIYTYISLS